jgi:hypothetical protein
LRLLDAVAVVVAAVVVTVVVVLEPQRRKLVKIMLQNLPPALLQWAKALIV